MDKNVLTRNLLILHQFDELAQAFNKEGIPVILLKGLALISVIPEYSFERTMDDMDLLIKPQDRKRAHKTLKALGYAPVKNDPNAFFIPAKQTAVDIIDNLWYMSRKENEELWQKCRSYKIGERSAFHLPPVEFYIHVLAHAAVHHGIREKTWLKDLQIIKTKWDNEITGQTLKTKLAIYGLSFVDEVFLQDGNNAAGFTASVYFWFIEHNIPLKGHILRFWFLPYSKKIAYLFSALFPSNDFISSRYNLINPASVFLYRILRPFLLIIKLFQMPLNRFN